MKFNSAFKGLTTLRFYNLYMYLTTLAPNSFVFDDICMVNTAVLYYNQTDL
jgi:hypothetical protein